LGVEPAQRQGRELHPGEAPQLEAALAGLGRELRCRPFDAVYLTTEFNAGVYQVPRLGFLGWPRTHLEIGLPLAFALSHGELHAVLAHECVHLSSRHDKQSGRLYLLHKTWGHLTQQLQRPATGKLDQAGRWVLVKFLRWYWPRLHARALVLSRFHEFQADRQAAEVTGTKEMVAALWRTECYTPWLTERFWPDLWQRTREEPEPPADVFRLLAEACQSGGPAPDDAARYVEHGLSRVAAREATHPAFVDRIRPLGTSTDDVRRSGFPQPPAESAAEVFFGEHVADFTRALSEQWRGSASSAWRDRHQRAESATIAPATNATQAADLHLLWETARTAVGRDGPGPAMALLRQVLAHDPRHAGAGVLLGQHLAGLGDPEGEHLLAEVVAGGDEDWLAPACQALEEYYRTLGLTERVRQTRAALDRHDADLRAARKERASVTARDRFVAHQLPEESIAALRALLASTHGIERAWLARKDLAYFPQRPLFVLCVRSDRSRWSGGADRDQELALVLPPKLQLPGQSLVIAHRGPFRALARKVAAQRGAEVFPDACS
jgi:hypothetical protein